MLWLWWLLGLFGFLFCVRIFNQLTHGRCTSKKCLVGKVAIVTGGNSGIGYETAVGLASRGCKVIIADVVDGKSSVKRIIETTKNPNIFYKYIDLGNFSTIRNFCNEIIETESKLDILINNAGCIAQTNVVTKDGLPKVLQVNYLGPFLLTHLLADLLKKSGDGRLVFVSSIAAYLHWPQQPLLRKPPKMKSIIFEASTDYANSKLFVLIASKLFGEKLKKFGVSCNAHHPGAVQTGLWYVIYGCLQQKSHFFSYWDWLAPILFKNAEQGAEISLFCALDDSLKEVSGNFYFDCKPIWQPRALRDESYCKKVWEESEYLVGLEEQEKLLLESSTKLL